MFQKYTTSVVNDEMKRLFKKINEVNKDDRL